MQSCQATGMRVPLARTDYQHRGQTSELSFQLIQRLRKSISLGALNKGKLYARECGLNKNTKNKKTPENIR